MSDGLINSKHKMKRGAEKSCFNPNFKLRRCAACENQCLIDREIKQETEAIYRKNYLQIKIRV